MKVNAADIAKKVLEAKEQKTIVFGTKQTMDLLRHGALTRIIYSNDLPETVQIELNHYSKLKDVETDEFLGSNKELGIVAKRAHNIAMLGFLKEAKE